MFDTKLYLAKLITSYIDSDLTAPEIYKTVSRATVYRWYASITRAEISAKTSPGPFDAAFYIKNVLPIVKRDGNRLIGPDFTFQQDGAKPHTSGTTMEAIESRVVKYSNFLIE